MVPCRSCFLDLEELGVARSPYVMRGKFRHKALCSRDDRMYAIDRSKMESHKMAGWFESCFEGGALRVGLADVARFGRVFRLFCTQPRHLTNHTSTEEGYT